MVRTVKEIIKVIPEPLKSHDTSGNRSEGRALQSQKILYPSKNRGEKE